MKFYKYCGAGNDFVLLDWREEAGAVQERDLPAMARRLCDRHFGVGADGLMNLPFDPALSRPCHCEACGSNLSNGPLPIQR